MKDYKDYLFEYRFEGSRYCFQIPATSQEEAERRLMCIKSNSNYVGEIHLTIDMKEKGFFAKMINFLLRKKDSYANIN